MNVLPENRRILVIDDNQAIHEDFRKILASDDGRAKTLDEAEIALFGEPTAAPPTGPRFEIDDAFQGQEGLERVQQALREGHPYALAFVDVRMPPGWDGIETIRQLWQADPSLQIVICTAYSDYSWEDMVRTLGESDQMLILKKPFDNVEVRQFASALTAKWQLARAAEQKMDNLEAIVSERTRDLEQQRSDLEEALARLQEVHAQLLQIDKLASIGQLAAGVAHEINNPIGFISSNLNSLEQYVTDVKGILGAYDELLKACLTGEVEAATRARAVAELREQKELDFVLNDLDSLITESIEGTHRVRQIVADLRDFSHVDEPNVAEEDVNKLIEKTINVAWNELKYKTEVIRDYGDIPAIPCYGGKLGQVFLNLLVNAAHAIEERGTVSVRTGQEEDRVWVEVEDTGCGIPPENVKRIFDPFFTTKDVGKGTGMGLHLAYKIIEAHAGSVNVHSEMGRGTTFRIELPMSGPPAAKETKNVSAV